jgi:hypothetical protein
LRLYIAVKNITNCAKNFSYFFLARFSGVSIIKIIIAPYLFQVVHLQMYCILYQTNLLFQELKIWIQLAYLVIFLTLEILLGYFSNDDNAPMPGIFEIVANVAYGCKSFKSESVFIRSFAGLYDNIFSTQPSDLTHIGIYLIGDCIILFIRF